MGCTYLPQIPHPDGKQPQALSHAYATSRLCGISFLETRAEHVAAIRLVFVGACRVAESNGKPSRASTPSVHQSIHPSIHTGTRAHGLHVWKAEPREPYEDASCRGSTRNVHCACYPARAMRRGRNPFHPLGTMASDTPG